MKVTTIPASRFNEKGYIYMRYVKPVRACNYHAGDIVKFNVLRIIDHPMFGPGFHFEEGLMEEVSNVDKLLLDANKMKYKEANT